MPGVDAENGYSPLSDPRGGSQEGAVASHRDSGVGLGQCVVAVEGGAVAGADAQLVFNESCKRLLHVHLHSKAADGMKDVRHILILFCLVYVAVK